MIDARLALAFRNNVVAVGEGAGVGVGSGLIVASVVLLCG